MKFPMLAILLILLPLSSALTFENTTFFASETNYTIHVDNMTLDNVTVTPTNIQFINLTSIGSQFTNVNTSTAVADFIGLDIGLFIFNINLSEDLFKSTIGLQNFNASFLSGHVLIIRDFPFSLCSASQKSVLLATIIILAIAIFVFPLMIFLKAGKIILNVSIKNVIIAFIAIIIFVVLLGAFSDFVLSFCPS